VRCAAAKLGVGSFAATLIAPVADAGEPVMYRPAPLLPAEATTMIPAFAAFVDATASGCQHGLGAEKERQTQPKHKAAVQVGP